MTESKRTPARELVLAAIAGSKNSDRMMRAAIERTFQPNLISTLSPKVLERRTAALLRQASPHHISHNVLRRIERNKLSVRRSISFRNKIYEMSEARNLPDVVRPTWKLDVKNQAYEFADAVGARRPKSDKARYSLADAPTDSPGVLKATRATGSRGCYLIYSQEKIVHVRDGLVLNSVDEMHRHARSLMGAKRNPVRDNWMWEELILEDTASLKPARDLKFYAFYGQILLMRESDRSGGSTKVAFWDKDKNRVETGHDQDFDFDAVGFTDADARLVREVSLCIPHPYIRIDILKGESEPVVGEFTPRPGNFDEFSEEWDRILGEAWISAESRLLKDLLRGKRFEEFNRSTDLLGD